MKRNPIFSMYDDSVPDSCQRQKFFICLNALRQKLAVSEQRIGRDRRGNVLRGFFACDVDDLERDIVFFCRLLHPWNPVIGVRALIGVIQDETGFCNCRMLCAFPEPRRFRIGHKRQIPQIDPAVGDVCNPESLVGKEFRVSEEFPFPALGAQNA